VSFERGAVAQALTSLDGRFLKVNAALAKMLGYESAELVGLPINEVTHPDDLTSPEGSGDACNRA